MITNGTQVIFRSPEDGQTYTGLVEHVSRDGIAKIAYEHVDFGEKYPQHECLNVL